MMAEPRDPRIRVDLNILRDANLDRLEEFAKQFSDPANRLADAMEKFNARAGRLGGAGGGSEGPGGASASASVAGPGGVGTGQGGGGGTPPGTPSPGASQPGSPQKLTGVQKFALAGPTLNQFERGQIKLGAFPGGSAGAQALFAASWLSGLGGWEKVGEAGEPPMINGQLDPNAIQGEDGGWYTPKNATFAGMSGMFGAAGQAVMRVPQAYHASVGMLSSVPNAFARIMGIGGQTAALGMQSGGYSRVGGWGLPFLSPAMTHGLGMDWQALKQSWFGFNPNYTPGQAKAVQQAIAASGFWGQDANFLASQMRNLQITSNMSPEETMALFDPLMRMGGEDRNRLAQTLKSLNDSAKAAHIGLDQFNQSLTTAAEQVSQQTGMQTGQAASMLGALSAGTRLNPQALAGLANPTNMIMGAALTHTSLGDIMFKGQGAAAALAFPMMKFQMMLGMPWEQYSSLKKTNPNDPRIQSAERRIALAYWQDPNVFGGLDPRTMMAQLAKGINMPERVQAYQNATDSRFHDTASFERIIQQFGAGGTAGHDLMSELQRQKWFHGAITKQNADTAQQWLTKRMSDIMNKSSDKAQQKVTLTLDNWARQLVHFKGNPKTSKSHSNTLENLWHKAIDVMPSAADTALRDMPAPISTGLSQLTTLIP